jgi:hypothetical protein
MKKTEKEQYLEHAIAVIEKVCHNPIKLVDKDDSIVGLWVSQYDLKSVLLLEQAGALSTCLHTFYGFKKPEEIDLDRDQYNPVYLYVGISIR